MALIEEMRAAGVFVKQQLADAARADVVAVRIGHARRDLRNDRRERLGRPGDGLGLFFIASAAAEGADGLGQPGDRRERLLHAWAPMAWSRSAGGLRFTLLTGGADQPAALVSRPACPGRPRPVVGLAERGRISEGSPAAWHVAPGGREADLIADDTVLCDRDRVDQRLEAAGLGSLTVGRWPGADGPESGHQASPACHARSPRVPGASP